MSSAAGEGATTITPIDAAENLREVLGSISRGEVRGKLRNVWFRRLVNSYLGYRFNRRAQTPAAKAGTESKRALKVIRSASIKTAIGGAISGALTTTATIIAAETPSFAGALIALPIAAVGIGAEMVVRSLTNLSMTCDLAAIFGVSFNPDEPTEFWQLYGLAFKTHEHEDDDDPGRDLVHRIGEAEEHEISEAIGHQLMGESVLKNIFPFVNIVISSVTNYRKTKHLGDTVRRYLRYRRALRDAFATAEDECKDHIDVLVEGLWFLFTADGQLVPEEATVLAGLLHRLTPEVRAQVESRFTDDETDWMSRLHDLPKNIHGAFFYALQVAAAVDKSVTLPEQKILSRAGRALGRELDMRQVEKMMQEFEEVGVLGRAGHR